MSYTGLTKQFVNGVSSIVKSLQRPQIRQFNMQVGSAPPTNGVIIEELPDGSFKVSLADGSEVTAHPTYRTVRLNDPVNVVGDQIQ